MFPPILALLASATLPLARPASLTATVTRPTAASHRPSVAVLVATLRPALLPLRMLRPHTATLTTLVLLTPRAVRSLDLSSTQTLTPQASLPSLIAMESSRMAVKTMLSVARSPQTAPVSPLLPVLTVTSRTTTVLAWAARSRPVRQRPDNFHGLTSA